MLGQTALRVEDGTVGRNAARSETVHQLLGKPLVGDNTHGFGIELSGHLESELNEVGLSMLSSVVKHSIRSVMKDLINKFVTEGLSDIGRCPEQADRYTTLKDGVCTRANTGTGSDEHHPAEHGDDPQNTVDGNTADP